MKFNVTITFSKIMCLVLFGGSVFVDIYNKSCICVPIALPIIGAIISSKHITDYKIIKTGNEKLS